MAVSAHSLDGQPVLSGIYKYLATYLGQPNNIKLFISRKLLNLDAFIFTIEQLMGRLIVIRILEDTGVVPQLLLKNIIKKYNSASDDEEQIWGELLDLFLDLRQGQVVGNSKIELEKNKSENLWALSGVDELHVNNKTARVLLEDFYKLDFSRGFFIVGILENWITEMSQAFRAGLEGSIKGK